MRFNVQEAKKAIREMNGATIAGQEIKVGKSWKPPELAKFGRKFYSLLSLALSNIHCLNNYEYLLIVLCSG